MSVERSEADMGCGFPGVVPRDQPPRRQPAADARRIPRLPGSGSAQRGGRARTDHDALGYAAPAAFNGDQLEHR
jgi:hypothetical protein